MSTWEVPRDGGRKTEQSCPAGTPLGPPAIPGKQPHHPSGDSCKGASPQYAFGPGGTGGLGAPVLTLMAVATVH